MSFGFGVGDLLTISQFVLQVYESCSQAPEQFAELRDQVKSLSDNLQALQDHITSNNMTHDQGAELSHVIAGFKPILSELNALTSKRRGLESKRLQLWQRLRWPGNQKLMELRSRFTSQLSLLSFRLDLLARCAPQSGIKGFADQRKFRSKQNRDYQALEDKFDRLSLQVESTRLPKQMSWQMIPLKQLTGIVIPREKHLGGVELLQLTVF